VLSFAAGEPDFDTPGHIKKAAIRAIERGQCGYTPNCGTPELRAAIADKFRRENGIDYQPEEIMVTSGASEALFLIIAALVDRGDEVIIGDPAFLSYLELTKLVGGRPVSVSLDENLRLSPEAVAERITGKTKLLILNSPSNPTGSVATAEQIKALAQIAEDRDIALLSDEVYEHFIYRGEHVSPARFSDNVITVNAVSKTYAMTGWRLGYMAGHRDLIKACEKVQSQFTSGPNSITQRAAITALSGDMRPTETMRQAFQERRDFLVQALREIPGLKVNNPPGAFYVFPDVSHFLGRHEVNTAEDLCMYLLDKAGVSCVTGDAFGDPHCIRISYATSMDNLKQAVERLKTAFAALN